jgi:flagellar motor switch protein FliM
MHDHINDSEAEAVVKLGETELTIGDLVNLQIGDVIPLSQEVSGELSLEVEGAKKLKCITGIYKGNRAVQVTGRVKG